MLADPNSQVICSFNVLNSEAKGMTKGMAHPGFFFIDESGAIREKYFEAKYTNRFTANNVIRKLFPELTEEVSDTVEASHLRLTLSQSDRTVVPGSRVTLTAEVELPPDVHVYSQGCAATSLSNLFCTLPLEWNQHRRFTPTQRFFTWRRLKNRSRFSTATSKSRRMSPSVFPKSEMAPGRYSPPQRRSRSSESCGTKLATRRFATCPHPCP